MIGLTAAPGATQRPRVQGAEILLQGAEFYLLIGQSTGYVLRPNYFQGKQNERVQIVDLVGYGGLAASRGPSKCPSFPVSNIVEAPTNASISTED